MTCKDCLHYEVCAEIESQSNRKSEWNIVEQVCYDFKDKSKFIDANDFIGGLKKKLSNYAKFVDETDTQVDY